MKKLVLLLVLFNTLTSIAQLNFENGYYITNSGDKIEGLIYNKDWNVNPTEFQFKASENADATVHTIKDVQEFAVSNYLKYVRATVDMDRSSEQLNSLTLTRNPIFNSETLFLRVFIEGGATLYYYQEQDLSRFFYKINEKPIEQLVYKSYQEQPDDTKYYGKDNLIKANNQYKQQLLNDLKCEELSMQDFERLEYKKRFLTSIFEKYNYCNNSLKTNFVVKKDRDAFNFSAKAGVLFSSLKIANNTEGDFGTSSSLRFGLEAEYILNFNNNKWSVFIEPTYYSFKTEKTLEEGTILVEYNNVEVPFGGRHYLFLNENSKFFVNAAVVIDLGAKGTISDKESGDSKTVLRSRFHPLVGVGYKFKNKISLELRYNFPRKIYSSLNIDSAFTGSSIIFGYTIF